MVLLLVLMPIVSFFACVDVDGCIVVVAVVADAADVLNLLC